PSLFRIILTVLRSLRLLLVPYTTLFRSQMHFDAAVRVIPARLVAEAGQVEIGTELAVDACEQIQIECRGDACRIVISEKLQLDGFLQIGTEQQGVTGAESSSYLAQELVAGIAIEDRKSGV